MKRIIFLFLFFLLGNYAHTQYDCGYTGSSDGSWRDLTCNMLDAGLTKEEVLAMPILYLDVVFHFETNQDGQNFTCDPDDPILEFSNNSHNLFIPTYLNSVMTEMNDRMSTNLEIDGEFIDSRIRYRFRNGDACNSSFFLEHVNRPINLPTLHDDAIDIILDTHDWGTTGLSPFGGG